jgi:hypothetical protein
MGFAKWLRSDWLRIPQINWNLTLNTHQYPFAAIDFVTKVCPYTGESGSNADVRKLAKITNAVPVMSAAHRNHLSGRQTRRVKNRFLVMVECFIFFAQF